MPRLLQTALSASLIVLASLGVQAAATQATGASVATRTLIVGELGYEGGPSPGGFHPTAGTVDVAFTINPLVLEKKVGKSGHFSIPLGPGTYEVTGCGPTSSTTTTPQCSKPIEVTLRAGEVDHLRLVWAYTP